MPMLYVMLIAASVMFSERAQAVSLAGRATDESVCDLSPLTNYRLTRKIFVPARTRGLSEIYARLALQFVTTECKNGQLLILHTEYGNSDDDGAFRLVSQELCNVADIQREATPTADYPNSFQIKCRIQKMQAAKQRLAAAEAKESTEEMIRTRSPWMTSSQQAPDSSSEQDKKKCPATISFGQLLGIGGGGCSRD
ncbi:hypothetical protein GCM10027277_25570 [Pseudoduganella ginsengisoli]|uniref:Uncharacterized protein n=1 Tax=Pseudoduganella ginsengisoli TaxID=1462440 RepID=A0A6L6PZE6_9BURK|nr:hypothetical protein [Pseudoduganella ginsengisoli]MTW02720.1 hypothetical protein [Pseudoduganella ginsengisoli]